MNERLLKALMASTTLKAADPADLQFSAAAWRVQRLKPGELVWGRGEPADRLAIVHKGCLEVELAGEILGAIYAGELVGEAGAFQSGSVRSANVRAKEASTLLVMDTLHLRRLRQDRNSVYGVLLQQASIGTVRRVRRATAWLARVADSDAKAPGRKKVSGLLRMWRALVPGLPADPPPALPPLLRMQPGLAEAPPEVVLALTTVFQPVGVREGEVVVMEGDSGERLDAMYIVASGSVDVLRCVRGGAKRLITLKAGDQFGCNALVEPGPRTASCVATSPVWLYRISKEDFQRPPAAVQPWWWESVLRNVTGQLKGCDALLAEALQVDEDIEDVDDEVTEARRKQSLNDLVEVAGFGMGDYSESELDRVEVVYDEAQLRRRVTPKG